MLHKTICNDNFYCNTALQHCSNIAPMCCTKNCRYESSRVTSPLHPSDSSQPLNFVSSLRGRHKKGRGGGGRRGTNPPPLFPFLPIPYPLPLSTPATQAILSQNFSMVVAHILDELWHFHTLNKHLFLCVGILVHMSNTGFRPFFAQKKFKDFSRAFKDLFPIFQGLHSVQKRTLLFHNMSNFIPKVFLRLLLSPWSST